MSEEGVSDMMEKTNSSEKKRGKANIQPNQSEARFEQTKIKRLQAVRMMVKTEMKVKWKGLCWSQSGEDRRLVWQNSERTMLLMWTSAPWFMRERRGDENEEMKRTEDG